MEGYFFMMMICFDTDVYMTAMIIYCRPNLEEDDQRKRRRKKERSSLFFRKKNKDKANSSSSAAGGAGSHSSDRDFSRSKSSVGGIVHHTQIGMNKVTQIDII